MPREWVTMKLVGAPDLMANLKELPLRTQKNVVDRALLKAAEPMHRDAQQRAKRASKGSGKNARKLIVSKNLSRRQKKGARVPKTTRVVYVGVRPSPVAHLIEFGTGPRYTKKGAYRGQMKASPYMRPAFNANWKPALDTLGQILGKEIEAAAARLARKRNRGRRL